MEIKITKKEIIYFPLSLLLFYAVFASLQSQAAEIATSLSWSTNTYVPSGYIGKPLPVPGSQIEVAADLRVAPSQIRKLQFSWFLNNKVQATAMGKQVFKFSIPSLSRKPASIKLEIRKEGKLLDTEEIKIKIAKPQVLIYTDNNPLLAVQSYELSNNRSIDFQAVPYFFNTKNPNNLNYQWSFNNQGASETETLPSSLTLKTSFADLVESVTQELRIIVENSSSSQSATKRAQITIIP